jgi:anti-anti-sigma regulatory factor
MSYIEEFRDSKTVMVLFGMKEKVANTFGILGLADLLHIRNTKAEAKKLADELSV